MNIKISEQEALNTFHMALQCQPSIASGLLSASHYIAAGEGRMIIRVKGGDFKVEQIINIDEAIDGDAGKIIKKLVSAVLRFYVEEGEL